MEDQRTATAINLLKQSKAQGKSYYEATQVLAQKGYSQVEIEQASYQFPYTDVTGAPTDGASAPRSTPPASPDNAANADDAMIQEAKEQVTKDFWYSFIPIIGAYYKTRRVGDYARYESLKTGQSQSTVLSIWIVAMVAGAFVSLVVAPKLTSLVTKNSAVLYASHYAGLAVAAGILWFVLKARKAG